MQIITIVKDDRVTGVEYGTVEIPDKEITLKSAYGKIEHKRAQIRNKAFKRTQHK